MKKENFIIIATIVGTLALSVFAVQPTTEASIIATPIATPSPRTKSPKPIQSPRRIIEVENDETHLARKPMTKVKIKKPGYKEGGVNDTTHRTRKAKTTRRNGAKTTAKIKPEKPAGFQEVSGIGMEAALRRTRSNQTQVQYNPKELQIKKSVKNRSGNNQVSSQTPKRSKGLRKKTN